MKASIAKLSTPVTIQEPKFDNLNGVGGFNEVQLGENIYLDRSDVDQLLHDNTEVFRLLHSSVIVKVIDLQRDSEGKVSKLGLETVDDISDDNDHSVVIRELKWVGDDLSSTSIDLRTENILPHLGDSYSLEEWRQIFQVETESGSKLSVTKVLLSESGVQMVKAGVSNVCLRDIGLCSMECISASHASENEEEDGQDNREESDFKIEAMLICSNNDLKEVYNKLKLATEIMKLQLLEIEDELEADNHQVVNEEAVGVVEVEQETTKAEAIHTEEVEINSTDEQVVVMDQEPCGNGIVEEHTTESQPSEEATITQQSQEKEEIDEERLLVQHSIPSMEIVHIDDQSQQSTYAEQTSQFSSSEIETEQTQSGKEIEDQCDSVEVRSETPTAIEEEEVTRMQASEEPDAVLARAHSESVDLHTSSLDNEQSEKPTHATTSISIENSSSIDENDLTLAQRRDLKAKKLQAEKQRKWQEYVAASSSSNKIEPSLPPQPNQGPAGASKKKLQERYEQAKLLQSQQEEERLSKLKNDPNKRLSAGGFESTKSKWSTSESSSGKRQSLELNPSGATEVGRLERAHRKDSMRLKWQGVLHVSKESELDRFQNARNRTISQFQLLEASGLVKKRIGEWEELFMQIAATAEQLEEFIRSAQALSMKKQQQMQGNMEEMIERFKEDCLIPENFVINDTHIYSADVFEFHVRSYFKKSLNESKTNHVSLSCGVYGEQAAKPPIDVFAAIIKTSDGKTYVAVTVKAAAAKELDPNVYGLKKIVVVAKDIDTQLFEKLIYVLPMPGWEQYIEGFENCYDPLASSSNIGEAAAQQGQQEEGIHLECVSEDANNLTEAEGLQPTTTEEPVELEHVEIQTAADSSDSNPAVEVSEEVEKGNPTADFGEEDQTNGNIQEEEEKLEVVEGEEGGDENLIVVEEEKLVIVEEEEKKKAPKSVSIQDDAANTISYYEQVSELDQSVDGANQSTTHIDASYISMTSADEGEGTWQSNYTPCKPEGAVEDDSKTLPSPILLDDPHDDNFDDFLEDSRSNSKVLEDNSTRGGGRRPSNASGRLSVDDDDDDGEPDLDVEDDANEMYHFGRTQSVASVMMVRSYMPMPNGNVTGTKEAPMVFAWKVDDEKETDLDDIGHIHMILDINDVVNVSTTTNAFVIQGSQSAMVFTGTLKYASVQSHYIVDQGKVFEWIRGAAASG